MLRLFRDNSGAAAVEFVLCMPFLVTLSIGVSELGRGLWCYHTLIETTRDATRWIEHGRIAARVPQFRFTVCLADVLASIEAVGSRRERGDAVFMESVVAPAILVSALPVQVVVAA